MSAAKPNERSPQRERTPQWEYRVIRMGGSGGESLDSLEATLTEAGLEGWECVAAVPTTERGTYRDQAVVVLILKREAP